MIGVVIRLLIVQKLNFSVVSRMMGGNTSADHLRGIFRGF